MFTSDCEVEAHCSVANVIGGEALIQSPIIIQLWLVNGECQRVCCGGGVQLHSISSDDYCVH